MMSTRAGFGRGQPVLAMALEDRQGHLWFATQKGVSHYDGESAATARAGGDDPDTASELLGINLHYRRMGWRTIGCGPPWRIKRAICGSLPSVGGGGSRRAWWPPPRNRFGRDITRLPGPASGSPMRSTWYWICSRAMPGWWQRESVSAACQSCRDLTVQERWPRRFPSWVTWTSWPVTVGR